MINFTSLKQFPPGFIWGVATSAFQIEGASSQDGRGPSIWDDFCSVPGAIADGSDGTVACNHYNLWQQDLDMIAALGVDAYRFSISWPRIRPTGSGAFNEKGLDFYERLIDGLLERGLKPYVTYNHWDLPSSLQQSGGWANRDTAYRFVEYAEKVSARMGNRLAAITTHNEPWVMAVLGYEQGIFAPGIKDRKASVQASHHLLLSHGLAMQALRAQGTTAKLGIVLNLSPIHSLTESDKDRAAARLEDGKLLRWYMDPLFNRGYPQDVLDHYGADAPILHDGDLAAIAQPMDYLGVNYYTRTVVGADGQWDKSKSPYSLTDMGWEVYPQGLTELLIRLHRDYPVPPLNITENGGAFKDELCDGGIHDTDRTQYLAGHIDAVADAMRQGVPMEGYMVWSLMDNFEWASGYAKRFGIVHVDYATQKRTLKDSAHWYANLLRNSA